MAMKECWGGRQWKCARMKVDDKLSQGRVKTGGVGMKTRIGVGLPVKNPARKRNLYDREKDGGPSKMSLAPFLRGHTGRLRLRYRSLSCRSVRARCSWEAGSGQVVRERVEKADTKRVHRLGYPPQSH